MKTAEIELYGLVGDDFMEEGFTADNVSEALASAMADSPDRLNVYINSLGGYADVGVTIHSMLRRAAAKARASNPAFKVVAVVDGMAASAASVIAMAGDEIVMMPGSQMMIHDAHTGVRGNAEGLRKAADVMEKASVAIASLYAKRSKMSEEDVRVLMQDETYFTAQEAVKANMADSIWDEAKAAALKEEGAELKAPRADAKRMPAVKDKGGWAKFVASASITMVPWQEGKAPAKAKAEKKSEESDYKDEDFSEIMGELDSLKDAKI